MGDGECGGDVRVAMRMSSVEDGVGVASKVAVVLPARVLEHCESEGGVHPSSQIGSHEVHHEEALLEMRAPARTAAAGGLVLELDTIKTLTAA